MDWLDALILGIIQGLTEFFPISSSGHLLIGKILLGIEEDDNSEDIEWLSGKITRLRIFEDDNGAMNLSIKDIDGNILLISQFTLCADTKKGNRPSFIKAMEPNKAKDLLGYQPKNPIDIGYPKYIQWYKTFWDSIKK